MKRSGNYLTDQWTRVYTVVQLLKMSEVLTKKNNNFFDQEKAVKGGVRHSGQRLLIMSSLLIHADTHYHVRFTVARPISLPLPRVLWMSMNTTRTEPTERIASGQQGNNLSTIFPPHLHV